MVYKVIISRSARQVFVFKHAIRMAASVWGKVSRVGDEKSESEALFWTVSKKYSVHFNTQCKRSQVSISSMSASLLHEPLSREVSTHFDPYRVSFFFNIRDEI